MRARPTPRLRAWAPRLAAVLLGAAAAASGAYWVLRVLDAAPASALPPAVGAPALPEAADPAVVARALGAASAPEGVRPGQQPVPSRLVLSGVAAGTSGRGTAIIAVDGAPPRAYPVGTRVAEGLVLQSVQGRRAQLGPGLGQPATVVLELPPLAR